MYTKAYWEDVNSIKGSCTSVIGPNLRLYCVTPMYTDVQRWMIITNPKEKGARIVALARSLVAAIHASDHPLVEVRCWAFIHCWREASA
jgi:hypothetical protein